MIVVILPVKFLKLQFGELNLLLTFLFELYGSNGPPKPHRALANLKNGDEPPQS